jgi:hypothetical protein
VKASIVTFLVGGFAGLCSVFVPRMGGLLGAADPTRIALFPMPFIAMGAVYAIAIGVVLMILYHGDRKNTLRHKFITALGVPTLIAGTLATGAQTSEVRALQAARAELADSLRTAADIRISDTPLEIVPLGSQPDAKAPAVIGLHGLLGIGTAQAQSAAGSSSQQWSRYGAIQAQEPRYAIIVDRTTDAKEALLRASQLKARFPEAQAIRTPSGFGVITGVKPESSAVLEAVKIKKDLGLQPELMRVK